MDDYIKSQFYYGAVAAAASALRRSQPGYGVKGLGLLHHNSCRLSGRSADSDIIRPRHWSDRVSEKMPEFGTHSGRSHFPTTPYSLVRS